ncbi:hypothetical protein [Buttiauxella gaviniae]|uniref:hypothetical protein n=1 Tax=Buttiauxella gaviniae TaxID=82990 RepID=UPI003C713BC0
MTRNISASETALLEIANSARTDLLKTCNEHAKHGTPDSVILKGTCGYATVFCESLIQLSKKGFTTTVRGGSPENEPAGYIDSKGTIHGHFWIEVATPDGTFIMDITADQFDGEPIIVLPCDLGTQYVKGDQAITEHMIEMVRNGTAPTLGE